MRSWKTPGGHRRVYRADIEALIEGPAIDPNLPSTNVIGGSDEVTYADAGIAFPVAPNESQRLVALERSGLLDTPPEEAFDRLTWLAAKSLEAPISLMAMLTPTRQWFKSRLGLDLVETPRSWAFCNHTILQQGVFWVEDLSADPRFAANPAVAGDEGFRFYAGAPILDREGFAMGTLCVLDNRPRTLNERGGADAVGPGGPRVHRGPPPQHRAPVAGGSPARLDRRHRPSIDECSAPWMAEARSEVRKAMSSAISSGWAGRPKGMPPRASRMLWRAASSVPPVLAAIRVIRASEASV